MIAYADEAFYTEEFAGADIPDLAKRLLRASMAIDHACRYRIGVLSDWPEFSQRQIKLATCAQAELDFKQGELKDLLDVVGSYSIGDVSVSGNSDNKKSALVEHFTLDEKVLAFLLPTGLLDRRV